MEWGLGTAVPIDLSRFWCVKDHFWVQHRGHCLLPGHSLGLFHPCPKLQQTIDGDNILGFENG